MSAALGGSGPTGSEFEAGAGRDQVGLDKDESQHGQGGWGATEGHEAGQQQGQMVLHPSCWVEGWSLGLGGGRGSREVTDPEQG